MQQLLLSPYFKKHDRHSYLFSVYLPTQCLFPHFTHTRTHFYLQEQQKIDEEGQQFKIKLIHFEVGENVFSRWLFVIKSQQLSSSFFTLIASFITRRKVLLLRCSPISRQARRKRRRRESERDRKRGKRNNNSDHREERENREEKKGGTFSPSIYLNSVDKRKRFV